MAITVTSNKNTRQTPMTATGRTGSQPTKFIPAPRIYIKSADSVTAAPVQSYFTKSSGSTPAGWTDLGVIEGLANITYNKEIKDVKTGIDLVLRASYVGEKTAFIEFSLSQFGDVVLEELSGLAASTIITGSTVNYQVGSEDIIEKALLLVVDNKITSHEVQIYSPAALLSFQYQQNGEFLELQGNGRLPAFTAQGASAESFMSTTFFA